MSAELSRIITQLQKEAASIVASGRTHAPMVADVLGQRFVSVGGQPKPDFLALQLGLAQMVEDELGQIDASDESLVDNLDDDRKQLAERIAATDELTEMLTAVQSACDGVYGTTSSVDLFGKVETLPRDPRELLKVGKRVHRRLADPEYPLPAPRLKGWPMSERQTVAADLGDSVGRLDRALVGLTGERSSSDGSRVVKGGVLEGFRRTIRYAAGCLASLYGLAGFDALAAKIRPKRRRRRATGGSGDEAGAAAEMAAAAASPESGSEEAAAEKPAGPTLVVSE